MDCNAQAVQMLSASQSIEMWREQFVPFLKSNYLALSKENAEAFVDALTVLGLDGLQNLRTAMRKEREGLHTALAFFCTRITCALAYLTQTHLTPAKVASAIGVVACMRGVLAENAEDVLREGKLVDLFIKSLHVPNQSNSVKGEGGGGGEGGDGGGASFYSSSLADTSVSITSHHEHFCHAFHILFKGPSQPSLFVHSKSDSGLGAQTAYGALLFMCDAIKNLVSPSSAYPFSSRSTKHDAELVCACLDVALVAIECLSTKFCGDIHDETILAASMKIVNQLRDAMRLKTESAADVQVFIDVIYSFLLREACSGGQQRHARSLFARLVLCSVVKNSSPASQLAVCQALNLLLIEAAAAYGDQEGEDEELLDAVICTTRAILLVAHDEAAYVFLDQLFYFACTCSQTSPAWVPSSFFDAQQHRASKQGGERDGNADFSASPNAVERIVQMIPLSALEKRGGNFVALIRSFISMCIAAIKSPDFKTSATGLGIAALAGFELNGSEISRMLDLTTHDNRLAISNLIMWMSNFGRYFEATFGSYHAAGAREGPYNYSRFTSSLKVVETICSSIEGQNLNARIIRILERMVGSFAKACTVLTNHSTRSGNSSSSSSSSSSRGGSNRQTSQENESAGLAAFAACRCSCAVLALVFCANFPADLFDQIRQSVHILFNCAASSLPSVSWKMWANILPCVAIADKNLSQSFQVRSLIPDEHAAMMNAFHDGRTINPETLAEIMVTNGQGEQVWSELAKRKGGSDSPFDGKSFDKRRRFVDTTLP